MALSSLTPKTSWRNQITELGGGGEQRAILWADSRRRYNAAAAQTLTLAALQLIEKHFNGRRASGFAFPLLDNTLYTVSGEPLGTGGGIATTNQLTVNRGDATNAYNREIFLPKTGTIHIYANAVEKTEGVDWTLAYSGATAGLVTWLTSVSGLTLTWTGEFYIPVRYNLPNDEFPDARLFVFKADGTGLVEGPDIELMEVRYLNEF